MRAVLLALALGVASVPLLAAQEMRAEALLLEELTRQKKKR